jgi:hypothetical protein
MTKSASGQGASTEKFPMVPDKEAMFVPTRKQRIQVCMMVYADFESAKIAQDLGISTKTLKRHFKDELADGESLLQKYAKMEFAEKAFEKSSVASLRTLAGLKANGRPVDEEPLGKKEQRKLDAESVNGGVFATPATPRKLSLIGSKAN